MSVVSYEILHSTYFETQYRFRKPAAILASYVEYYWELDLRGHHYKNEDFKENLLAHLNSSLVFNLGNAYELYNGQDCLQEKVAYHAIIGVQTHLHAYKHFHGNHLFGIKFKPGALNFLFGITGEETTNHLLDFSELITRIFLDEALYHCKDLDARTLCMDDFLVKRLSGKDDFQYNIIRNVLQEEAIKKTSGIASGLYVTTKSMERYFKQLVGVSPKKCLNILRFRKALKAYTEQGSSTDFEALGYYDLSHFRKDYAQYVKA